MSLMDDFRSVLVRVRDIAESPTFKDVVSRDIAALENAATNGLAAVENHVTGWFAAVYGSDPGTGIAPVAPAVVTGAPAVGGTDPAPLYPEAGQDALPGT